MICKILSAYERRGELRGEIVLRVALLALKTVFARDAAQRLLPGIRRRYCTAA